MVKSPRPIPQSCGNRIGQILREIHPRHTIKLIHADTKIPTRTLERILDGTVTPSFDTYSRLLAAYPRLLLALGAAWASVALAAVEMETLDNQRARLAADMDALRARMEALR